VNGTEDMLRELRQQTQWLRLLGLQQLRPLLLTMLSTNSQKTIYELSDGQRSVRDIARLAGVGSATVSRLWNQWQSQGVATESDRYPGRAKHLMSLTELGIDVPQSPTQSGTGPTPDME
jgi:hypothetical protein